MIFLYVCILLFFCYKVFSISLKGFLFPAIFPHVYILLSLSSKFLTLRFIAFLSLSVLFHVTILLLFFGKLFFYSFISFSFLFFRYSFMYTFCFVSLMWFFDGTVKVSSISTFGTECPLTHCCIHSDWFSAACVLLVSMNGMADFS